MVSDCSKDASSGGGLRADGAAIAVSTSAAAVSTPSRSERDTPTAYCSDRRMIVESRGAIVSVDVWNAEAWTRKQNAANVRSSSTARSRSNSTNRRANVRRASTIRTWVPLNSIAQPDDRWAASVTAWRQSGSSRSPQWATTRTIGWADDLIVAV